MHVRLSFLVYNEPGPRIALDRRPASDITMTSYFLQIKRSVCELAPRHSSIHQSNMYERGSRSSGFAILVKFPALESSAALNSIKRCEKVAQSCRSFWREPLIRANERWPLHHMDSDADARVKRWSGFKVADLEVFIPLLAQGQCSGRKMVECKDGGACTMMDPLPRSRSRQRRAKQRDTLAESRRCSSSAASLAACISSWRCLLYGSKERWKVEGGRRKVEGGWWKEAGFETFIYTTILARNSDFYPQPVYLSLLKQGEKGIKGIQVASAITLLVCHTSTDVRLQDRG